MRKASTTNRGVLTERDRFLMQRLAEQVKTTFKLERKKAYGVALIAGISHPSTGVLVQGKTNYSVMTLLRAFDALGYEIVPVKRAEAKRIEDVPDAMEKIQKLKTYNKDAKRRQRGQPTGDLPGKEKRVKKSGRSTGNYLEVYSRRRQLDGEAKSNDFLSAD